ncbi:hypothetical protein DERP_002621 [Dermatophagoides pteronyssinus]|uniref:Uncharacterized protein n=1 Tax=Dermatophagoides pteronyssinus TaxID=6956 RepID=A0ABQ8JIC2_DERPT|nr:hypothetical protein DERP_002621 [Dermatophagoides pteronyssinus]
MNYRFVLATNGTSKTKPAVNFKIVSIFSIGSTISPLVMDIFLKSCNACRSRILLRSHIFVVDESRKIGCKIRPTVPGRVISDKNASHKPNAETFDP